MNSVRSNISSTATARVLVVDDQPANIQMVGTILGKLGYEIVPANDGATALKRLMVKVPDLILLDLIMPGMNGFEVCRRIRENPAWKEIPVIFISAADDKDLVVRAFEEGGVDYVTKPFNHSELLSRVRTHLALKAARDRLQQLAEDKDELMGILAHDLKNHVSGIQLSAEMLRTRTGTVNDPKFTMLLDNMCRSSNQLLAFLKQFLSNASMEHGFVPHRGMISLSAAISKVVNEYSEVARQKGLSIRLSLAEPEIMAYGDMNALNQVLDNLVSNAVKFSPAGKEILVTGRVDGDSAECIVQDQGPGFTNEDKSRMFRRYGRLSARPTGGEPSTGLGLSIVKRLTQQMGGDVLCETVPGQGATFTIRLPRSAAVI